MIFFYKAKTQHENLGDRGIARVLLKQISRYGSAVINVRGVPADYRAELQGDGHTIVDEGAIAFVWRMFKAGKSGHFVMKPGHFFGDDGGLIKRLAQLATFAAVSLLGVRVHRVGASVGPYTGTTLALERVAARLYTTYSVRESISMAYCEDNGISRAVLFPDLAFALRVTPLAGLETENGETDARAAGLVFGFRPFSAAREQTLVLEFVQGIVSILRLDNPISKVHFVSQVTSDFDFNEQLRKASFPEAAALKYGENTSAEIFEVYGHARFVVSNRLHMLLFAAARGALPIALVNVKKNLKIVGIFADAGFQDLVIDINSPDLVSKVLALISKRDEIMLRWREAERSRSNEIASALERLCGGKA